jgi:hypothetical protein
VLCVVRLRSLCRADHSLGGVLPNVVYRTECDREASTVRRPWPTGGGGCRAGRKKKILLKKLEIMYDRLLLGDMNKLYWTS